MTQTLSHKQIDHWLAQSIPGCRVESRADGDGTFSLFMYNSATQESFKVSALKPQDYPNSRALRRLGKQVFEDMVLLQAGCGGRRLTRLANAQPAEIRQAV